METINLTPEINATFDAQHDELEKVTNFSFRVTIRQAAQQAVDNSHVEGANAVVVTYPDGKGGTVRESFSGPDSDALYQENPQTGQKEERPLPAGASVEAVRSGRGAWRRS